MTRGEVHDGRSRFGSNDSLLPGLVDDVALHCLAWVSRSDYATLSCINKRFHKLVSSGSLYGFRKQLGIVEHWVYLVCDPRGWEAFDTMRNKWMTLPKIPCDECFNHADKESLAVGSELLVFGRELLDFAIWKYSVIHRGWEKCQGMNRPRCLFGSSSLGSIAIVAGGIDKNGNVLKSAELYDSSLGRWETLTNMHTPRKLCSGFFMEGKFYVIGGGSTTFTAVPDRAGSVRPSVESVRLVDDTGENVCGCSCENCGEPEDEDDSGCPCWSLFYGLELDVNTECGPSCSCGLDCGNRLSQKGISVRLKIVRDVRKGWCLFADQSIRKGEFICEYAGELLTTEAARKRHRTYDELSSNGHFSFALLVLREHLPSGKACLRMNIDATRIGNVARFINHSCDGGNLFTKLVRSSGALFPRLCFFTSKDIKEGEELTFSYGEIRKRPNCLQCFCGSSFCFGILPSEDT